MPSRKRGIWLTRRITRCSTLNDDLRDQSCQDVKNKDVIDPETRICTLQELAGNAIRKQVEDERKSIRKAHLIEYECKRSQLESKREEVLRQLSEVEEEMKRVEIDCYEEMLKELDHFDTEVQPEVLGVLTEMGQLDRICPLCEQYFRSSEDLPACCLGRDRCYLHNVQRCCFSCLRPGFYDIFQCLAFSDSSGYISDKLIDDRTLHNDLAVIESAASTPELLLDEIFGAGIGGICKEKYAKFATIIARAVIQMVPSESGSVTCPVCRKQYCDYDFLYHFAGCCRCAFNHTSNGVTICFETDE